MHRLIFWFSLMLSWSGTVFADIDQPLDSNDLQQEAAFKQRLYELTVQSNIQVTENQSQFDVVYYGLDLFPDHTQSLLSGSVIMIARSLKDGLDQAQLNFLNNMTVDSVFANSVQTSFVHTSDLLTIQLGQSCHAGDLFTTRVVYHGLPSISGFGAFAFDHYDGRPMIWTLSEPFGARNWWPCKDAPIDKADSVDIKVTVPDPLIVVSNGLLTKVENRDGIKAYYWEERYPIATYLVSLAIHPYFTFSDWYVSANHDSMKIDFYVFRNHYEALRQNYAKTADMIKTFADIFGEYPFIDEKYGHAEFTWGGGMEHQTITSLGGWSESLIAHELAHQWWGDMVTCEDFHHIWLNEGFATYSEALWWERTRGREALHQDMSQNVYFGEETIYVENPETEDVFFYQTTYAKASWVLHMLRHVVGDDPFFSILKRYYEEFKFKTINTEEFQALCERISGKSLHAFFQQWIYERGAPFYQYSWGAEPTIDGNGYQLQLVIKQIQSFGPIFQMPIDVIVQTATGEQTFVIDNSQPVQVYTFALADRPLQVFLDKENWILKRSELLSSPQLRLDSFKFISANGDEIVQLNKGESYDLVIKIYNEGVYAHAVKATLHALSDDIELVSDVSEMGDMPFNSFADNAVDRFRLQVKKDAQDGLADFRVDITYLEGAAEPLFFQFPVGEPSLLIVDDDDGMEFESYYEQMAIQNKEYAITWNVKQSGVPSEQILKSFSQVIWFTGDDRSTTLTAAEQILLQTYLQSGGCLLLTGQNIGYDLVETGSANDRLYYNEVLHAEYISDQVGDDSAVGVLSDLVGKGLAVRFHDAFTLADNQTSKSEIIPLAPAVRMMTYLPSQKIAAIRYSNPQNGSKLAYFAFGLEGIAGPKNTSAADVVVRILQWFDGVLSEIDVEPAEPANSFQLIQNYPNPFNPSTSIRFYLPAQASLRINISDVLSRSVYTMDLGILPMGWHKYQWDGRTNNGVAAAAGVYFLKLTSTTENSTILRTIKMLKLN